MIIAKPDPFSARRVISNHSGQTLDAIVKKIQPDETLWSFGSVWIGDICVDKGLWGVVRPKIDQRVLVCFYPQGGDSGKVPRTALLLAISIAAPGVGAAASGATSGLLFSAATIGFTALASMAVNALIPTPENEFDNSDISSQARNPISASFNSSKQFGVKPQIFGKMRVYPPYAARPFTEIQGDDRYLRMLFFLSKDDVQASQLRLGETDITSYHDVEIEFNNKAGGTGITLFPFDVFEDNPPNGKLTGPGEPIIRTTQENTDEVNYDLLCLNGLQRINKSGGKTPITIQVNVEFSLAGQNSWSAFKLHTITGKTASTLRDSGRLIFPVNGQYDVRFTRLTADIDPLTTIDIAYNDDIYLEAFRSIRNIVPVDDENAALCAIRIRETDQLNGQVADFNMILESVCLDWNGSQWIKRATNNPASLSRLLLQGSSRQNRLSDDRLSILDFQAWAQWCADNNKAFNQYQDFTRNVYDTFKTIASAGRAKPNNIDGKWTITQDIKQNVAVDVVTPRMSWGFSGSRTYYKQPHAFRVKFRNEDEGYNFDYLTVYADGYNEGNAKRFEDMELPGVTNPDQIFLDSRYRLMEALLRNETFTFSMDVKSLAYTPGDRIDYLNDVILVGLGAGSIAEVDSRSLTLDDFVRMESGKEYGLQINTKIYPVISDPGEKGVVKLKSDVTDNNISVGDSYGFGEIGKITIPLVISSIIPGEDLSAKLTLKPEGRPDIEGQPIPPYNTYITQPPGGQTPAIINIRSDESVMLRNSAGTLLPRVLVSFGFIDQRYLFDVDRVQSQVKSAQGDDTWHNLPDQPFDVRELSITDVEEGLDLLFRARYLFRSGVVGEWTSPAAHRVVGKTSPPPDVVDFRVARLPDGTRLYSYTVDDEPPDLAGFRLRYTSELGTVSRDQMILLHEGIITSSPHESNDLPAGTYQFSCVAVDTGGRESTNDAFLTVTIGDPRLRDVLLFSDERQKGWPGSKLDCFITGGILLAVSDGSISDLPGSISELSDNIETILPSVTPCVYDTQTIDLGASVAFTPTATATGNGSLILKVSFSDSLPLTSFVNLSTVNQITARYIKFKVISVSSDPVTIAPKITSFNWMLDAETKVIDVNDFNTNQGNGSYFHRVGAGHFIMGTAELSTITNSSIRAIQNIGAGWSWELIGKNVSIPGTSNKGAEIKLYNASNNSGDAVIDLEIKGVSV